MTITTRDLIGQTLFEEISKENPQTFSVIKLAKKAHVARSTMYYQFSSINDVYSYLLNTHFFEKMNKQQGYCIFIRQLGNFIEKNHTFCSNLTDIINTDQRHEYLFEKFYDYLSTRCRFMSANIDRQSDFYKNEIEILVEFLIFQINLWLEERIDKQYFYESMQQHFKSTRNNLVRKRRNTVFSKNRRN